MEVMVTWPYLLRLCSAFCFLEYPALCFRSPSPSRHHHLAQSPRALSHAPTPYCLGQYVHAPSVAGFVDNLCIVCGHMSNSSIPYAGVSFDIRGRCSEPALE